MDDRARKQEQAGADNREAAPNDQASTDRGADKSAAVGPKSGARRLRRPDLKSARARMEQSILDRRRALVHCGVCGAQGDWLIETVRRPLRYLVCRHCGVGRTQIAVLPAEIDQALGKR